MAQIEPWSKKHKQVTGGLPYSLSNSFAQPLNNPELIKMTLARGDNALVDEFHNHSLVYTPNGGSLDLRAEIASLYGPNINADNIVVFTGGQVALQTAAMALLDDTCHSIVFAPGYQSVQQAPLQAGSSVTTINLRPENNWQIDISEVAAAIRPNTKYIALNDPHNPTGLSMGGQRQQQLKDLAKKHNIHIMSDEVYRLLEHNEQDRIPAMADLYDKGLSVCTLSKPWGGCGITIGWIALQDMALKQRIIDTQYFGTACPSRASELQSIMVLRSSDTIISKNLKIIRHNLSLLDAFMDRYSQFFAWVRPTAGAIAFIKFKGPLDSNALGEQLAQAGISIKPAYVFSENTTGFEDYCRIGFGESIFPRALEALTDFVETHKGDWLA